MTSFKVLEFPFNTGTFPSQPDELRNWPVVYVLTGAKHAYVGETHQAINRMSQHIKVAERREKLRIARVIVDSTFNKSACHDLEAFLIKYLDGDSRYTLLNRNAGQTNYNYYNRERYQAAHNEVFETLKAQGLFTSSIREIENTDLYKFSPFKQLTDVQSAAVANIAEGLIADLRSGTPSTSVVEGAPGTGKTVIIITLLKLLRDIQAVAEGEEILDEDVDGPYGEYYLPGNREVLRKRRIGIVVPQKSLRKTLKRVFAQSPALKGVDVLTPWEVGKATTRWDVLVIDEAHRLSQFAAQSFGGLVADFRTYTTKLFGEFDSNVTQLDWIRAQSDHQVFVMDQGQGVIPADLPKDYIQALLEETAAANRRYKLESQLRVQAGGDYVDYIRAILANDDPGVLNFENYDLRFYDDPATMHHDIRLANAEHGLARMLSGFAWPHISKGTNNTHLLDIQIGDFEIQWNRKMEDWVESPTSINEAGSIYTIQGYDLNIAGVIIGPDLVYRNGKIQLDAKNYFDPRGNQRNNNLRGITYTDEDIQQLVINIYTVLLTRGIYGTYVYVVDSELREYLRPFFPAMPQG